MYMQSICICVDRFGIVRRTTEYALHQEWLRDWPCDATATTRRTGRGSGANSCPAPSRGEMRETESVSSRCRVGTPRFRHRRFGRRPPARPAADSLLRLQLTHIFDRRAREKRAAQSDALAGLVWTDRFDDLLHSDVDIIVEAVGGVEPAADWIRAALLAGKSVVTANKQVIAHHGPRC